MKHQPLLRIVYTWQEGTVPPPHYYEYTLVLGPGPSGQITYRPGYAFEEPPAWTEAFDVAPDAWARLTNMIQAGLPPEPTLSGDDREPVGGSTHRLRVEMEEKTVERVDHGAPEASLAKVIAAVRDVLPAAIWHDLRDRHTHYRKSRPDAKVSE